VSEDTVRRHTEGADAALAAVVGRIERRRGHEAPPVPVAHARAPLLAQQRGAQTRASLEARLPPLPSPAFHARRAQWQWRGGERQPGGGGRPPQRRRNALGPRQRHANGRLARRPLLWALDPGLAGHPAAPAPRGRRPPRNPSPPPSSPTVAGPAHRAPPQKASRLSLHYFAAHPPAARSRPPIDVDIPSSAGTRRRGADRLRARRAASGDRSVRSSALSAPWRPALDSPIR
jgi:hypothetical protein